MISSKVFKFLEPYFHIIENSKGKTIGQIKQELNLPPTIMKKGASGLIVENLLGLPRNNNSEPDILEIGCEVKVLPLQKNKNGTIKAKEPTQIQMINFCNVAQETWETASIKKKINLTFWIVYLAKHSAKALHQDDYVIIDYFLDHPNIATWDVFKQDWEVIHDYIVRGEADKLSCSLGQYIEPKTKGANNQDTTNAPDGNGGLIKARRRAFYFKKKYTEEKIISNLDLSVLGE